MLKLEVRFGQLITNLSDLAVVPTNEAIWDMEDHELLGAIRLKFDDLSHRQASVA